MELKNINNLLGEIEYLKKCESLLNEVSHFLGPHDHEINGEDIGNLGRRISELLTGFDDNE